MEKQTQLKAVLKPGEDNHINGFGDILPNSQLDFRYDDKDNFYIIIHGKEYEEPSTAFDFIEVDY